MIVLSFTTVKAVPLTPAKLAAVAAVRPHPLIVTVVPPKCEPDAGATLWM